MIKLRVEDKDGNGFRAVEVAPFDFFSIEGARCWNCAALPVSARRVDFRLVLAAPPELDHAFKERYGWPVVCECGELFGLARERGR